MATHTSILAQAQELAKQAGDEIASLEARKAEIDFEIKRLRRFVSVAMPDSKSKSGRRSPSSYGTSVAPDTLLEVATTINSMVQAGQDEFTALEVAERMGRSQPKQVYTAFRNLRNREFIAKSSRRTIEGTHQPRDFYRLLDADAIEKVRAGVAAS